MTVSNSEGAAPAGSDNGVAEPGLLSRPWYRNYVLGVLFFGYVINFVDRSVLGILLEPIRREFGVSDTQLGLLSGLPFALFYATLGIPIAALADRTNRRNVLALAMLLWSGMTALCGLAVNFVMLFFARIGTAIGEAGGSPPSHALISDYFPVEKRATALSIYASGVTIGAMVANFAGGWGAEFLGWRLTFILVGIPGVILALLVRLTVREPPRGYAENVAPSIASAAAPSMRRVCAHLWSRVSFRHLAWAAALQAVVAYGMLSFAAPFLIRSHDLTMGEAGSVMGVVTGLGTIGTFFGGYIADKLSTRYNDRRWYMWVPGIAGLLQLPIGFMTYFPSDIAIVIPFFAILNVLGTCALGPIFATTQSLVPLRMRAVAAAIILFVSNLVGQGLGPFLSGAVSDLLDPISGVHSLRYAMLIVVLGFNCWAIIHYFLGARTLRADLERTEAENKAASPE